MNIFPSLDLLSGDVDTSFSSPGSFFPSDTVKAHCGPKIDSLSGKAFRKDWEAKTHGVT